MSKTTLDDVLKNVDTVGQQFGITPEELKQAIISLIKEMVAEAEPGRADTQIWRENPDDAWDMAIDEFEQNLLKVLEKQE